MSSDKDFQEMSSDKDFQAEVELRLGAALEELRTAEAQVTRLKRRVEGLKEVMASFAEPKPRGPVLFRLPSSKRSLAQMSIKDAAKTVLKEHGEPMTTREIFDEIVARGKKPGGKSPIETLRAILRSTDDVFKKTPDSKWTVFDPEMELRETLQAIESEFGKGSTAEER